ncbi:protein starmaker-like [Pieris rapae]|uniref:protein starmaker-like n=1 Tax=Pieris rapae TaxID=64459 RepID=UPI001E27D877|nr:protein starmaker-like [Pieris rapae]
MRQRTQEIEMKKIIGYISITDAVVVKNNSFTKQNNVTENITSNTTSETVTRTLEQSYENSTETINKNEIKSNTQLDNDNITIGKISPKPSKITNSNKEETKKISGHYKNNLRKRRSTPLVYDYITHHGPKSNGELENEGIVLNSSLADFLIKTSHDRLTPSDTIEINQDKQSQEENHYENDNFKEKSYKPHNKKSQEIDESSESSSVSREDEESTEISNQGKNYNDDSRENKYNGDVRDEIPNSENYNSREVNRGLLNKDISYLNAGETNSREAGVIGKEDIRSSESNSSESDEEKSFNSEENTSEHRDKIQFKVPVQSHSSAEGTSDSNESIELKIPIVPSVSTNSYRNDNKSNGKNGFNSESNESEENTDLIPKVSKYNDEIKQSEEIDKEEENNVLVGNNRKSQNDDYPTEKFKNNDLNLNANVSDESTEQSNDDHNKESFISKTIIPDVDVDLNTFDAGLNDSLHKNNSKLRNIHDDEVKPVKELNEDSSAESNEENYKYVQTLPDKNVNSTKIYSPQLDTNEQTSPKPQNDEFDENLNIKFSDISLKLPEIILPDDILSYNYEKPVSSKQKTSNSHNDESREDELKTEKTPYEHDDENYTSFSKSYKTNDKQSSGEKDEDYEDEDLYEKFVRERFGKRTLKEAKNSKYIKPNKELFNTIHNVLKKTEKIQQEAEKSGDPNASYAWTLEYGESL